MEVAKLCLEKKGFDDGMSFSVGIDVSIRDRLEDSLLNHSS